MDDSCHSEESESIDRNGTINVMSSDQLHNILERKLSTIGDVSHEKVTNDHKEKIDFKTKNYVHNHLYLLQFSAEWCGLCSSIQPLVQVS